jgi:hypothetical protein
MSSKAPGDRSGVPTSIARRAPDPDQAYLLRVLTAASAGGPMRESRQYRPRLSQNRVDGTRGDQQPFDMLKTKTGFARALINFDPWRAQVRKGS